MLSIGSYEIILIVILVLVFVKPEDLPSLLEKLGKICSQLKRHFFAIKSELSTSISDMKDAKIEFERELKENFDIEKELGTISEGFDSVKTQELIKKSNGKDPSLNLEVDLEDKKEFQEELKLVDNENDEKRKD